jgi:hypothetical protein
MFNSQTSSNPFQPQNLVVHYTEDGIKTKKTPDEATISQQIVNKLGELEPNEANRPTRDADWLKTQYGLLKTEISEI